MLTDLSPEELAQAQRELGLTNDQLAHVRAYDGGGSRWIVEGGPVDVRTFLTDPDYLNALDPAGRCLLYPGVLEALVELCEGDYVEAVLTGAIGCGKTTLAVYCMAYQLYRLLCHRDPHAEFGLDPSSELLIVFQSLNAELGAAVDFERFRALIDQAPIFQLTEFRYDRSAKSPLRFRNRIVAKPVSGEQTAAIGQNVHSALIDELNYMAYVENSKRSRDTGIYDQAVLLYDSIARRRKSRFMERGRIEGMLCLVSSKRYPGEFTERKIEQAHDPDHRIFLYDKRVWEVRPERFSDPSGWFPVFVGDLTRNPRVLKPDEEVPPEDRDLVYRVPPEYRSEFKSDLHGAIRDILGLSTLASHTFVLDRDALAQTFCKDVRSAASRPDVDFQTTQLQLYPGRWRGTADLPRFVHLDLSRTRDSSGIAIGHCPGFAEVQRTDGVVEWMPIIRIDLLLEVLPPPGGEIPLDKIRRLLYMLRENGMPVKWVTADQYQSADMLQTLQSKGFMVGEQSVDRTSAPYDVARAALCEGRVVAPFHDKALQEWTRLELDPRTGKVDHPPGGSKDLADAMTGVIYGLTRMTDIWTQFDIPLWEVPDRVQAAVALDDPDPGDPDDEWD